jgi:hypothetical protein
VYLRSGHARTTRTDNTARTHTRAHTNTSVQG